MSLSEMFGSCCTEAVRSKMMQNLENECLPLSRKPLPPVTESSSKHQLQYQTCSMRCEYYGLYTTWLQPRGTPRSTKCLDASDRATKYKRCCPKSAMLVSLRASTHHVYRFDPHRSASRTDWKHACRYDTHHLLHYRQRPLAICPCVSIVGVFASALETGDPLQTGHFQ